MTSWKTYKLKEVVQFNPTERIAKGTLAKKVSMDKLVPYCREVSAYEVEAFTGGMKFRNGDTIMARITPCLENGKTSYVSFLEENEVGFGSTEYIVFRAIEDVTDSKFIYYFVTSPAFRNVTIKSMVGSSGRQRVQQSVLEDIEVAMPSLAEQRRIAGILGAIDDKIENNRRINTNLELQAQALFNEWLSKATATKGTFNNIIDATLAGDWGQEVMQGNYTHEVYCIRGADIPALQNGDKGKMPIRYILEKNYITKRLRANDLVIEISGGSPTQSTGRICMVTQAMLDRLGKDVVCTNFCRAITPKNGYAIYIYLYWQMLYNKNTMFSYENGTTGIKNFNISDFINKEEIEIPTAMDMKNLNGILQPIYNQIYANGLQNETLATLRDTLLPKLMNGEIKTEYNE
ncbi:MAG: restriction endonuclease subunit S [Alistipes sp.]|nr:restriction endonuclease subunit S [Alistipes sp.]